MQLSKKTIELLEDLERRIDPEAEEDNQLQKAIEVLSK